MQKVQTIFGALDITDLNALSPDEIGALEVTDIHNIVNAGIALRKAILSGTSTETENHFLRFINSNFDNFDLIQKIASLFEPHLLSNLTGCSGINPQYDALDSQQAIQAINMRTFADVFLAQETLPHEQRPSTLCFNAQNIPYFSEFQIAEDVNGSLISLLCTSQRVQSLKASQIRSFNNCQIKKLTADHLNDFSIAQVQEIKSQQVQNIRPEIITQFSHARQMAVGTETQLKALFKCSDSDAMDIDKINALSPESFCAIRKLNFLSKTDFSRLSAEKIALVHFAQIEGFLSWPFTVTQMPHLDADLLNRLTYSLKTKLNAKHIEGILKSQLNALPPSWFWDLKDDQKKAFIDRGGCNELQGVALWPIEVCKNLTLEDIETSSIESIQALPLKNIPKTLLEQLFSDAVGNFSAEQIFNESAIFASALGKNIVGLTAQQIAEQIGNTSFFRAIKLEAIQYLKTEQIRAIPTECIGYLKSGFLSVFSAEQFAALKPAQIRRIKNEQFKYLNPAYFERLNIVQLRVLKARILEISSEDERLKIGEKHTLGQLLNSLNAIITTSRGKGLILPTQGADVFSVQDIKDFKNTQIAKNQKKSKLYDTILYISVVVGIIIGIAGIVGANLLGKDFKNLSTVQKIASVVCGITPLLCILVVFFIGLYLNYKQTTMKKALEETYPSLKTIVGRVETCRTDLKDLTQTTDRNNMTLSLIDEAIAAKTVASGVPTLTTIITNSMNCGQ